MKGFARIVPTIAAGAALCAGASDAASPTSWIVFAASPQHGSQPSQLFRIRATGTGLRQITTGFKTASSPDFSPDGKHVVFMRGLSGIFVVNVDGTGLTRLTDNRDDDHPVWSPDGRTIAFLRPSQQRPTANAVVKLFVMAANGTHQHVLPLAPSPAGGRPSWLPGGQSIVISARGRLYQVNATNGKPSRRFGPTFDPSNGEPHWTLSPNGKTIAWIGGRPAGCEEAACEGSALYLLRFGASRGRRLTDDVGAAGWSRDSRVLAFTHRGTLNLQQVAGGPAKVLEVGADETNAPLGDSPPTLQH